MVIGGMGRMLVHMPERSGAESTTESPVAYQQPVPMKPTAAFVGASWAALLLGVVSYSAGLWNAELTRSEKGFYFAILLLGVFGAISLQKSVRDKAEGLPVSALYLGLSWSMVGVSVIMMVIGLFNAGMAASEKGFYGIAFAMTLFAAVAVQKNVRDSLQFRNAPVQPDPYVVPGHHHV
jgi:uncharacterized membrane protein YiaA